MIPGVVAASSPNGVTTDPYFSKVVLLVSGAGEEGSTAIADSSLSNHPATVSGNTNITKALPAYGAGAIAFDGNNDVLSFADSADFDLDGDFTIEFNAWFNTLSGTQALFSKKNNDNGAGWVQVYKNTSTGQLVLATSTDGSTHAIVYTSGAIVAANTKYHIAIVRDGNICRFFFQGTQIYSTAMTTKPSVNTEPLRFAQAGPSNLYDFNGKMNWIRITKGVARYTADFTPGTDQFPAY